MPEGSSQEVPASRLLRLRQDSHAGSSRLASHLAICLSVCASSLLPSNALLLVAPSAQDSAQFECVASNEVGEARKLYQVTVQGE